jgi:hypothetical protein
MRFKIGVFGRLVEEEDSEDAAERAWEIGLHVANRRGTLITGVHRGLPHLAACGAAEAGGIVIGVSPAGSFEEHAIKYGFPIDDFYRFIYTGLGEKANNLIVLRSCDAVVCIFERVEAFVYDKLPAAADTIIFNGTGQADEIPWAMKSTMKVIEKNNPGDEIFFISDPQPHSLIERIFKKLRS